MNKARKNYIKSCEVSEVAEFTLGGYRQKVLIEGKTKNLPVVITLHGGPGSPVPFSVGCRGLFPEWTERAVMVYWDQLGCGINNRKLDDGFTIRSFVDMTCELVSIIKQKFPDNKLFLFGISWGSILALNAAARLPEIIDGVLVYGQLLKNVFFNQEIAALFDSAAKKAKSGVQKILATGKDCEYAVLENNLKKLFKLLNTHTDAYFNKNSPRAPMGKIVKGLLTSPDYSFKDFSAVVKNGYKYNKTLWREILNMDLTPLLNEVNVKYIIMQGETDAVASTRTALNAVESRDNKNVTVKVVKNSGHMPSADAMDEIFTQLCELIK